MVSGGEKGAPFWVHYNSWNHFLKVLAAELRDLSDLAYPNALLLDSSRAITGDTIDLGATASTWQAILAKVSGIFFHPAANTIYLRNRANTAYASLIGGSANFANFYAQGAVSYLQVAGVDNSYIKLMARDNDTDVMTECAKLLSGSEPELGINRAGNISLLAAKKLDGSAGVVLVDYDEVAADPWAVPMDSEAGAVRVVRNTTLDEVRLYVYADHWYYIDLVSAL